MELLEYQAKQLFRMVDIPILPSQTIKDSRKIKQLQIPYPVVLKSQVRSGGRGKAGGVRFVANTIDAIAAARTIFNLSILGEYPEVILAEAHYNTEREFLLAIVLDYDLQRPVLLGSALGGMNVDSLLANLQQVIVEEDFSLFYARRLAANMGLSGKLICSVSEIIAKMYRLFQENDLDLIEINPLGVNTQGELMALDGKITINDFALGRQTAIETLSFLQHDLKNVAEENQNNQARFWQPQRNADQIHWCWLNWQNKAGKIAVICDDFDLALLTWDLLKEQKIIPACCALIENSLNNLENLPRDNPQLPILKILNELESFKGIKAILINIRDTEAVSREIITAIATYSESFAPDVSPAQEEQSKLNRSISSGQNTSTKPQKSLITNKISAQPQFVLRLLDKSNLDNLGTDQSIYLSSSLEEAVTKTVALVKSS